ncbi:hypothetical protein GTW38_03220, partial [Streptomyces sp. SID7804]|nr:hypothetical protein [Streptomyces sp. SID7804]
AAQDAQRAAGDVAGQAEATAGTAVSDLAAAVAAQDTVDYLFGPLAAFAPELERHVLAVVEGTGDGVQDHAADATGTAEGEAGAATDAARAAVWGVPARITGTASTAATRAAGTAGAEATAATDAAHA